MAERVHLPFDATDPLLAAAAWSRLAEPGDQAAGALVGGLGAVEALDLLASGAGFDPPEGAARELAQTWARVRERWAPRLATLDPRREVEVLSRLGGRVVLPGDPEWPAGLDDLGPAAPHCLWVRGVRLGEAVRRSAAVVGSRACTVYGQHVAAEIAAGIAERGVSVVSGGAYGIDAAAHRGCLAATGTTLAVLAGGVDRPYPAGNAELLEAVRLAGAVISEVPPGSAPSRSRFLMRNRLLAAMTRGVVVVEAAWRSGALNTAAHAAALLRPVGAVPGPVTSTSSAGCHRLLRETDAVCVTDAAEVVELVGDLGRDLAGARPSAAGREDEGRGRGRGRHGAGGAPPDGLEPREARVLESLPLRGSTTLAALARVAGLGESDVRIALGFLELAGLARQHGRGWRREGSP